MQIWNLDPVEQAFAEAALDPTLWVKALETASIATRSYGAVLIPISGGALTTLPFTESITEIFETYIRDGWHLRDERMRGTTAMTQRGVVVDFDLFDAETITRHPYYQEFLAPHRLRWWAGLNMSSGDELWCLSMQRTIDQEPFSKAEQVELTILSKRLSASVATARAFGAAAADGALEAFDISGTAVVLINRHGRIFLANQSALQLLVGDVQIKEGRLDVQDSRGMALLNAAINDLLLGRGGGLSAPIALRRTGRSPLVAYPVRPSGKAANALADCQAMIVLIDPDTIRRPPEETLRRVFNLTEAEARLGRQMALGESLETVAERLGISKETSRSQLKSIFAKARINRQSALVAMLSALLGDSRDDRAM
jgi:DNA-binding CsgD family transcriptional regulator/PAS domain-containing protein